ncbi:MAG: hypothetical protein HQK52_13025 [Oligoflexia bacterium]|nr:hypothetical protein [Oligoflexia bacterium]
MLESIFNKFDLKIPLAVAIVYAQSVNVKDSPEEFKQMITHLCEGIRSKNQSGDGDNNSDPSKQSIRALLKFGKYRATGRGKPASEYLYNLAREQGAINFINNIVDANNFISLKHQLPISIFDLDQCTPPLTIRHGLLGERYIFNQSGQDIDLQDLLLVADSANNSSRAIGNPIKDSMATKVFASQTAATTEAKNVLGVIYANKEVTTKTTLTEAASEFALTLTRFAGATTTETQLFGY